MYIHIYVYIHEYIYVCIFKIYIYIYIYIYIFKKKNKDRLIQDYKFISFLFVSFWCEPKTWRKKFIQDFFRSNG